MKIRFGISLGANTPHDQLAGTIDHLESSGVDSLWFSELVYSPAVDPVVGMAYALARTEHEGIFNVAVFQRLRVASNHELIVTVRMHRMLVLGGNVDPPDPNALPF